MLYINILLIPDAKVIIIKIKIIIITIIIIIMTIFIMVTFYTRNYNKSGGSFSEKYF